MKRRAKGERGRAGEESIGGPHNKQSSNSLLLNATVAINLSIEEERAAALLPHKKTAL